MKLFVNETYVLEVSLNCCYTTSKSDLELNWSQEPPHMESHMCEVIFKKPNSMLKTLHQQHTANTPSFESRAAVLQQVCLRCPNN